MRATTRTMLIMLGLVALGGGVGGLVVAWALGAFSGSEPGTPAALLQALAENDNSDDAALSLYAFRRKGEPEDEWRERAQQARAAHKLEAAKRDERLKAMPRDLVESSQRHARGLQSRLSPPRPTLREQTAPVLTTARRRTWPVQHVKVHLAKPTVTRQCTVDGKEAVVHAWPKSENDFHVPMMRVSVGPLLYELSEDEYSRLVRK